MATLIKPVTVTNAVLEGSNVTEDDYAEWNVGTTYAEDDFVIVIGTTHKVYQSVQNGNTGNNPVTDATGTWWIEVSATNRWKAFDQRLVDQVERADSITYSLRIPERLSIMGLAFFNVEADSIRVQVFNAEDPEVEIYDQTSVAVQSTNVDDWYSYYHGPFDQSSELIFLDQPALLDAPGFEGYRIAITITRTGGTAKVGQIVFGPQLFLGETLPGTRVGSRSFSRKDQDAFGRPLLLKRATAARADYVVALPTDGAQRLKKILDDLDSVPVVWLAGTDTAQFGTTVYGWWADYDLPLEEVVSFGTIEVRGLV